MQAIRREHEQPFTDSQDWEVPAYELTEFIPKRTTYAVVIPVINEGQRIITQISRMQQVIREADTIIVDGGSSDGSLDPSYLQKMGLAALLLKTGPGKLSAQLRLGLAFALQRGYEGVILIDGNNKDNPEAISQFVVQLELGFDHLQGSRFIPGGKAINNPWIRLCGIRLLHAPLISWAAGVRYTDTTNGFRAYSRRFLLDPAVQPFRDVFSTYELHYYLAIRAGRLGFRVKEIPVTREYPAGAVPTKISKFRGNFLVLSILFKSCFGVYNPQGEA